jgi:hypothetical protein
MTFGQKRFFGDELLTTSLAIEVHAHAEPERLRETLAAIEARTPPGFDLLFLPDGSDPAARAELPGLRHIRQSATVAPFAAAVRLSRSRRADIWLRRLEHAEGLADA